MWLATLNPGGRTRRGRRKRRTLSAWQRMVKKAGGVMQAVKLRKKLKTKGRRTRRRRNPYLTTALTSGGAAVGMNAPRRKRRRKIRSRRSAVSRRSRRGRSRRAAARRSKMARKTRRRRHRRMPPRGRGGRFKSRSSHRRRRRRTRRNPVLPISWNPRRRRRRSRRNPAVLPVSWNPTRRRRRRRARRNPLFLSRRGFSNRKHRGYRRLHRRRRSPRFWHNPVGALTLRSGPVGAVMGNLQSFIDVKFWTETGLPAAGGYFGSKAIGGFIMGLLPPAVTSQIPAVAQPFVKMTIDAIGGSGLAYVVGRFYSKKAGDAVWLGTVVNVAHALLKQLLGGTDIAKTIGLDGLGDDLADRMRSEIARRVEASVNGGRLNGMGSYLRATNLNEYVTEGALRSRGSYSPGNALGDEGVDNGAF